MRFLDRRDRGKERSHGNVKALRGSSSSFHRSRQSAALQRRDGLPRGALRVVTCPACKTGDHRVLETREVSDAVTRRRHRCAAGHRWSTYERVDLSSLDTTGSVGQPLPVASPTTTRSVRRRVPTTTTRSVSALQVAFASPDGGVGGGLPSGSSLVSLSPCSKQSDQTQNQTRVERPSVQETAAFASFYAAYPRKKARPDAFKAWRSERCEESSAAVMIGLAAHMSEMLSRPPDRVPYPASWLRGREWEDPVMAPRRAPLPEKVQQTQDAMARWLAAKGGE